MKLTPFALEQWFARYEFDVRINLAASCAPATGVADLLALGGQDARDEYLSLGLDYIPSMGTDRLRAAVADWYDVIKPDQTLVTTGASEAIFLLMNALLELGDTVVVQDPIYQSLYTVAEAIGARVRKWPLRPERGFVPDIDELERMLDASVRLLVINHPHNPTGAMLKREELDRLVELADRLGFTLVSDEVYRGTTYTADEALPPAADLSPAAVSVGDMTKPFGLGGLRIGWVAAQDRGLLARLRDLRDYTTMCSNGLGEFLAAVALEHREELIKQKLAPARANLTRLGDFIAARDGVLDWTRPRAGFSAFPRLLVNTDAEAFCAGLVREESMLLLPGNVFGVKDRFRIGFGQDNTVFNAGLDALDRYLQKVAQ